MSKPRGRPRFLPPGPLVPKTWRIPKALDAALRRRARADRVPVNLLVVNAIEEYLKQGGETRGGAAA